MTIAPGFAAPVFDSQTCFRAVLDAMSRPGRIATIGAALRPPAPIGPAAGAVLLALVDAETPLWLDAGPAAEAWLRFHCGAPVTAEPGMADFLLATGTPPALATLRAGSEEEPQGGATLILQVDALEEGRGWRLSGPGIQAEHRLHAAGMPQGFTAAWAANRARFPRGVDLILCAGDRLAALPRTTRVTEG